jgi:large subunit ribosomal protein L10
MSDRAAFAAPAAALARGGFIGTTVCASKSRAVASKREVAPARIHMRSDLNLEKKALKVESVQERLQTAQFVFQVPLPGIAMSQISKFKRSLPEGTTMRTVKNTLMRRAIANTDWAVMGKLCKESTIWLFVDDDIKGSVAAYKMFLKENKREEEILGGALENTVYDGAGIEQIAALPSKQELYAKIAMLVQMVPTKLAKSVKEVPSKLGRAINLAFADPEGSAESVTSSDETSAAPEVNAEATGTDETPADVPNGGVPQESPSAE